MPLLAPAIQRLTIKTKPPVSLASLTTPLQYYPLDCNTPVKYRHHRIRAIARIETIWNTSFARIPRFCQSSDYFVNHRVSLAFHSSSWSHPSIFIQIDPPNSLNCPATLTSKQTNE